MRLLCWDTQIIWILNCKKQFFLCIANSHFDTGLFIVWRISSFTYFFNSVLLLQVNAQATVPVEMWYSRTRGQTVPFSQIIRVRIIINQMQHISVSDFLLKLLKVYFLFITTSGVSEREFGQKKKMCILNGKFNLSILPGISALLHLDVLPLLNLMNRL